MFPTIIQIAIVIQMLRLALLRFGAEQGFGVEDRKDSLMALQAVEIAQNGLVNAVPRARGCSVGSSIGRSPYEWGL
jgi:hypothetical protein